MAITTTAQGMTRRDCLQLGLGVLGRRQLCRSAAAAGAGGRRRRRGQARPTSCILIWMDGGPTHFETFDPKPDAPAEIRGEFKPIATKIPGVHFSQHMTRLAGIADKLAIVRSICHNQGNHGAGNHYMMTGAPPRIPVGCGAFVSFHPSLGSVTAYERRRRRGPAGLFLDAQHVALRRAELPGREVRAVRRRRRSEPQGLSRPRRGPARRA